MEPDMNHVTSYEVIERPSIPATQWPPMNREALEMMVRRHVSRLNRWLQTRNDFEAGVPACEQGASALLCPVAHHALRHAAIDMPDRLVRVNDTLSDTSTQQYALPTIAPGWGGLPVERAWEQIAQQAGHVDRWRTLLSRARASVVYYIQTHGVQTLRNQLAGITPWPTMPGSDDPHADSTILQSVQGDGYLIQRAQEVLLQGNPSVNGSNVLQHAAMLLVPLAPQPARPASPRPTPPEDDGSALIRAQREEYRAAENADRQRQQQQQRQRTQSGPDGTDSDALRAAARARRQEQVTARTSTQEQVEAEAAEIGQRIWSQVAEREQQQQHERQQQQQPDLEQVRRARTERFAGAHSSD